MRRLAPLFVVLALSPLLAHAQNAPPRVFVIFDTSGSMLWNPVGDQDCRGDGSATYPHRGCAGGSKLFHAKQALSQVVSGVDEVEFGLLRYGQLEPDDPDFDRIHVGAQYRDAAGNPVAINYDGSSNGCGPADLLVEPGPMSRAAVLGWMDGQEDYPREKELRADGYTPLTQSLASARDELLAALADDPESQCRPYYVLLLTDGYQQCPEGSADDPAYRALVRADLVNVVSGLRALPNMGARVDVRTFVVGFGAGTRFATELDDVARAGGTAVNAQGNLDLINGTAYQADDPAALQAALTAAVNQVAPHEACDGVDNDCDDRIDEDYPRLGQPCHVGQGACGRDGVTVCAPNGAGVVCSAEAGDPQPERCNGADDDCDGRIDEGTLNRCGECGPEPVEICDGADQDCDGAIDEGTLNRCGSCGTEPRETCNDADDDCDRRVDEGTRNRCGDCGPEPDEVCDCRDNDCDNRIDEGLQCPRCDCDPHPETCNAIDDDCDNLVDEDTLNACGQCGPVPEEICNDLDDDCDGRIDEAFPEAGMPCGSDEGECAAGAFVCVDGALDCAGERAPTTEVCDAVDNDCDGATDEGAANACGQCGPVRFEVCDNIDNDCDGRVDQGDGLCAGEARCENGECAEPCQVGECFNGQVCLDGHCVTPCRNADCPSGHVCDDGRCVDPCDGFACPDGTYCALGRCVEDDCYGPAGCPDGQFCRGGVCVGDPCAEATCGENQGCFDGQCFDDCRDIRCPEGTLCINGGCTRDPCARVTCPYPQTCVDGTCGDDPCLEVACPPGFTCRDGACAEDLCTGVTCPPGATCTRGRCSGETGGGISPEPLDQGVGYVPDAGLT
ncbi:MAG: hypothetical protein KC620_15370, partial [Myxococcales bacterium]|nr:hypothetical protein [Myxococcales bacterium]